MALMVLPLKRLVALYLYLVSAGLLAAAHTLSSLYVQEEQRVST